MTRLVVVGAGIAGLAGACAALDEAAQRSAPLEVVVVEARDRVGGMIETQTVDGVPLEWGPDGFATATPEAMDLCDRLHLETVATGPRATTTSVVRDGTLRSLPAGLAMGVPTGLLPLVRAIGRGIVGPGAAARAAMEPLLPRGGGGDTAGEILRRRLGDGVTDALVAPLVQGIFGSSVDEVAAEVVPGLTEPGSMVWRSIRGGRGRPAAAFHTVVGGMMTLPRALAATEGLHLRLSAPVRALVRDGRRWAVRLDDDVLSADAVMLATPTVAAGALLAGVSAASASLLSLTPRRIAVIHVELPAGSLTRVQAGSGYLADPRDETVVSALTLLGAKWPHLGAEDRVRATVTRADLLDGADDDDLARLVAREVGAVLGVWAEPVDVRIQRWRSLAPAPTPAARALIAGANEAMPAAIALAGSAMGASGLPACIRSGERAGRALVAALDASVTPASAGASTLGPWI